MKDFLARAYRKYQIGYRAWFPGPKYPEIAVAVGLLMQVKPPKGTAILFEKLNDQRSEIEDKIGYKLDWNRALNNDNNPNRHRITTWRNGS